LAVQLTNTERLVEADIHNLVSSNLLNFRADPEQTSDFIGLVASIRKHGLIQPLLVRELQNRFSSAEDITTKYEIISGYRRWSACKKLGLRSVRCRVLQDLTEQEIFEIALIENIQRQSLSAIEEAEAFKSYVTNFGRGSISELATKIGKSEEYVSHRLLLLGLPKPILNRIRRRLLRPAEATELVWLNDQKRQLELAEYISKLSLSFRQTRKIAKLLKSSEEMSIEKAVNIVLDSEKTILVETEVRQVTEEIDKATSSHEEIDPWISYPDEFFSTPAKTLEHSILMLRTCLAGMDQLVTRTQDSNLHDFLLQRRLDIHKNLDQVIRYKIEQFGKRKVSRFRN
jgi:ParB/RepB/Spo0J family partition protein